MARRKNTHSVVRRHNKDGSVTTTHRYGSTDIFGNRHVDYYTTKQSAQQFRNQQKKNQEEAAELISIVGWILIIIAVILGSLAIKIGLYMIGAMILGGGLIVFGVKLNRAFPNALSSNSKNNNLSSSKRNSSSQGALVETKCPYCGAIVEYSDAVAYKKCENCGMTLNIKK